MIWMEFIFGVIGFFCSWFLIDVLGEQSLRRQLIPNAPNIWRWIPKRKIQYSLNDAADFLDLFSIALSAGLSNERAFALAGQFLPDSKFKEQIQYTIQSLELGQSRDEAIDHLIERLKNKQVSGIFVLIKQSLKRGSPLQSVLLEQARRFREHQLLMIEKQAQTAGIRLLFPIMFFIFPSIFILIFGSLVLQFSH